MANKITFLDTNDKQDIQNQLDRLTARVDIDDTIPNYVVTEAERVISDVIAAQGSRTFTFAAISDLHYGNAGYTDGILHATQALKYIDERIKLDAVAVLGDYTDGYPASNITNAFNDFKAINKVLNDLRFAPNLRQQGNHDFYVNNNPITHRFIQAYSDDVVWGDKLAGYYYKDFDEYKLRVISLNTIEEDNSNIDCSAKQYEWFVKSLDLSNKEDMNDWQILILSHHPLDWYTNDAGSEYWYRLPKILNGYVKGLKSETASGYGASFTPVFDFSKNNNRAKVICNIHGHIHNFLTNKIYLNIGNTSAGDVGVWRMATPEACINRSNQYDGVWKEAETYDKTVSTAKDTSFVVYCIDLDSNLIKAICYGAGRNRVLNYTTGVQEVIYAIVNNLTNVNTNNNTASVGENDSYTATLTPSIEGDMTITVTMGGVDVTSSAYKNGVITIGKVTGDVIITAAVPNKETTIYSVTKNSTRTVLSNNITSIEAGQSYSSTVSADYADSTYANAATIQCTVTMGGADVTSEVYSNGVINIASVTGDIEITTYAYVNMINLATDNAGNLFNSGQGYKVNYRLNSTGSETAIDSSSGAYGHVCVTGFIPVQNNDIIRLQNMGWSPGFHSAASYYICFYDQNFTFISGSRINAQDTIDKFVYIKDVKLRDTYNIGEFAVNKDTAKYMRISYGKGTVVLDGSAGISINIKGEPILTVNEEIPS